MNRQSIARRWKRPTIVLSLIAVLALAAMLSGCGLLMDPAATEDVARDGRQSPYADPVPESGGYDSGAVEGGEGVALDYDESTVTKIAPPPGAPGAGPDAGAIPAEDRLVIRRVDMRLRVENVGKAVDAVRSAVDKHEGTVIDLNVSTDDSEPVYRYAETPLDGAPLSGYLTVRLPAASLDAFLDDIADVGTVLREAENLSDVTQEHVDLNARLVNLRATEAQLRDFLKKAKNVTEMLAVEQELSRVRGEIEAMQAQIAYLERQAAHSTVTIELTGPKPIVRPTGEDWGFAAALTESVRAFMRTVNTLIVAVGAFAPLIVILAIAWLVVRGVMRRARRTRGTAVTEETPSEAPSDKENAGS